MQWVFDEEEGPHAFRASGECDGVKDPGTWKSELQIVLFHMHAY